MSLKALYLSFRDSRVENRVYTQKRIWSWERGSLQLFVIWIHGYGLMKYIVSDKRSPVKQGSKRAAAPEKAPFGFRKHCQLFSTRLERTTNEQLSNWTCTHSTSPTGKTEPKQPKFHPESEECLAPTASCLHHSQISRQSQEGNPNYCVLLTLQNISYYYVSAMAWQVLF